MMTGADPTGVIDSTGDLYNWKSAFPLFYKNGSRTTKHPDAFIYLGRYDVRIISQRFQKM
jgi:hypothetical protein